MKAPRSLLVLALSVGGLAGLCSRSPAEEADSDNGETVSFNTDWKGERIALPPRFAPAMTLKGFEEIRFAPGMFDAKSDSFFTYAFVFSISKDQELTRDVIQREILTYYRGLAESVSKSKGRTVDASEFKFKLEQAKDAAETPAKIPASAKVTQYTGELKWVEPFVTAAPQVLHFEIQSWTDPATARNYLFVCTSPKAAGASEEIWNEMRKIRRSFAVKGKSGD